VADNPSLGGVPSGSNRRLGEIPRKLGEFPFRDNSSLGTTSSGGNTRGNPRFEDAPSGGNSRLGNPPLAANPFEHKPRLVWFPNSGIPKVEVGPSGDNRGGNAKLGGCPSGGRPTLGKILVRFFAGGNSKVGDAS